MADGPTLLQGSSEGARIDGTGRATRTRKPAKPIKVAIIHNVDFDVNEAALLAKDDDGARREPLADATIALAQVGASPHRHATPATDRYAR